MNDYSNQIQREHVLMEVFAGTLCVNLYGAELGIMEIIKNSDPVVIVRHDYCICSDGQFENEAAIFRQDYYNTTGYPVAFFNGIVHEVGGGNQSLYVDYLYAFTPLLNDYTSFDLEIDVAKIDSSNYIANVSAYMLDAYPTDSLTLHLALTIDTVEAPYYNLTFNHCIQHKMLPDHYGSLADFSTNDTLFFAIPFTFDELSHRRSHTLIAFLQNDNTKEIVQDASIPIFFSINDLDICIKNINGVAGEDCNGFDDASVYVQNLGIDTVTSFSLNLQVNDQLQDSLLFEGTLNPQQITTLSFPDIMLPEVDNEMVFYTSRPNGQIDEYLHNDTTTFYTEAAITIYNEIIIKLRLDQFPGETSWEVRNTENNVVMGSGGPYYFPNSYVSETVRFFEEGCYEFSIFDSAGDGLLTYNNCRLGSIQNGNWYVVKQIPFFKNSFTYEFYAVNSNITAGFSCDNDTVCEGSDVEFLDLSSGSVSSWEWVFEGGAPPVSYQQNPVVNYNCPGEFDVTMIVCHDTICDTLIKEKYIHVNALPDVIFDEIPDQCINWPPYGLIEGSPPGGEYSGPGIDSGYFHPNNAGSGTHWLTYTFVDGNGCENSAEQTVYVDACVGVEELTNFNPPHIFPNPLQDLSSVFLFLPEPGFYGVTIFSTKNKTITVFSNRQFNKGMHQIDLKNHNLTTGVYIFKISTAQNNWFQKILIRLSD
ncbi:MAG: hypothetical protein B6I19_09840 [Bacteroidetes bacterium 4572_114]|nr:MAG: hypothetical protein B6I19_09840 [Bacteroidetes bacterium 4572_114]